MQVAEFRAAADPVHQILVKQRLVQSKCNICLYRSVN